LFIDGLAAFLNPIPAECFSQGAVGKGRALFCPDGFSDGISLPC